MKTFVCYYRVSTKKQGESGLGIDAQKSAVARFLAAEQGRLLAEFVEIESGKKSNRPELRKAIDLCKATGATLVVAKLDRLARNVAFTSALMDSGIEFLACDMPYANRLTIHILAAIAEDEARRISQRTKAALAELKAQGVPLGSAREGHWERIREKYGRNMRGWAGMDARRKAAIIAERFHETYKAVIPLVHTLYERGVSKKEIARVLNTRGLKTSKGSTWTPTSVGRIVEKLFEVMP
jgi:DNA invertase Pin-like site-specific DNA recombinase